MAYSLQQAQAVDTTHPMTGVTEHESYHLAGCAKWLISQSKKF